MAIDIDGTLVNSSDELTPGAQAALRSATAAGIHVVLATGRRYRHTLHLVEPLGIGVPLVTAGGALIKDPATHRTLFKAEFDRGLLCELLAALDRAGCDALLNGDTFAEGFDFYQPPHTRPEPLSCRLPGKEPGLRAGVARFLGRAAAGDFRRLRDGHAGGNAGCGKAAARGAARVRLPRTCSAARRYRGFMCELAPAGVTKWSGIRHLAADWGIADAEICAVGDDVNDIPMIRAAGLGVAMGNAVPEVQRGRRPHRPHARSRRPGRGRGLAAGVSDDG